MCAIVRTVAARSRDPRASVRAAIEAASTGTRRVGSSAPLGPKAIQTRQSLLEAAFRRFTAAGYAGTTVADIAEEAGVSLGTFYQYFADRKDVIAALAADAARVMLDGAEAAWPIEEGRAGVRKLIRAMVKVYALTAAMQAVWEEVTHVDRELAFLRRELNRAFTDSLRQSLERGRGAGLLRADMDPAGAALALSSMVDRTCYLQFVVDRPRTAHLVDHTTDLLTDIWWAAIAP